jgi:hypothetical protein
MPQAPSIDLCATNLRYAEKSGLTLDSPYARMAIRSRRFSRNKKILRVLSVSSTQTCLNYLLGYMQIRPRISLIAPVVNMLRAKENTQWWLLPTSPSPYPYSLDGPGVEYLLALSDCVPAIASRFLENTYPLSVSPHKEAVLTHINTRLARYNLELATTLLADHSGEVSPPSLNDLCEILAAQARNSSKLVNSN